MTNWGMHFHASLSSKHRDREYREGCGRERALVPVEAHGLHRPEPNGRELTGRGMVGLCRIKRRCRYIVAERITGSSHLKVYQRQVQQGDALGRCLQDADFTGGDMGAGHASDSAVQRPRLGRQTARRSARYQAPWRAEQSARPTTNDQSSTGLSSRPNCGNSGEAHAKDHLVV